MTLRQTINLIKKFKPKNEDELRGLGLKLKYLGYGAFRVVYQINNLPIVIKLPSNDYSSLEHSKQEIMEIRRINKLKSLKYLKKYVPKVYYQNYRHGIIIMQKAKLFISYKKAGYAVKKLEKILNWDDLHSKNIGKIGKRLVIFDLGIT